MVAAHGCMPAVYPMVQNGAFLDAQDSQSNTALRVAAEDLQQKGTVVMMSFLNRGGIFTEIRNVHNFTPILVSCEWRNHERINKLFEKARVEYTVRACHGTCLLHMIPRNQSSACNPIQFLDLVWLGLDPLSRDHEGASRLHGAMMLQHLTHVIANGDFGIESIPTPMWPQLLR